MIVTPLIVSVSSAANELTVTVLEWATLLDTNKLKLPHVPKYPTPLSVPLNAASAWLNQFTKLVCWIAALTSGVITKNQALVSSISLAFILASVLVKTWKAFDTDTVIGLPSVPQKSPSDTLNSAFNTSFKKFPSISFLRA